MNEPNQKPEGWYFLGTGFAWPRTFWGTLPFAFVCAAVVAVVYLLRAPKTEEARRLWTPIVVETNGTQTVLGESRQMEFWTPSARTKEFLAAEGGVIGDKHKWEIIPSDDVALKFGSLLHSNFNVLGYRRVEVWGHGRTSFKPGWWWSVNVTTNCPVGDLTRAYQDFWKPPSAIFIEVIDNRGGEK